MFNPTQRIVLIVILTITLVLLGCGETGKYSTAKYSNSEQIQYGIATGVQLGLEMDQVINILGKPDEQKKMENGSIFLVYRDIEYGFQKDNHKLKGIFSHSKNQSICGIKVGMSFAEAKRLLGTPSFEGAGGNTNEFNGWIVDYEKGTNILILSAKGPNDSISQIILLAIQDRQRK